MMDSNPPPHIPFRNPPPKDVEAPRQRIDVACQRCRRRKIKCSGWSEDQQKCSGCIKADHACEFVNRPSPINVQQPMSYSSQGLPGSAGYGRWSPSTLTYPTSPRHGAMGTGPHRRSIQGYHPYPPQLSPTGISYSPSYMVGPWAQQQSPQQQQDVVDSYAATGFHHLLDQSTSVGSRPLQRPEEMGTVESPSLITQSTLAQRRLQRGGSYSYGDSHGISPLQSPMVTPGAYSGKDYSSPPIMSSEETPYGNLMYASLPSPSNPSIPGRSMSTSNLQPSAQVQNPRANRMAQGTPSFSPSSSQHSQSGASSQSYPKSRSSHSQSGSFSTQQEHGQRSRLYQEPPQLQYQEQPQHSRPQYLEHQSPQSPYSHEFVVPSHRPSLADVPAHTSSPSNSASRRPTISDVSQTSSTSIVTYSTSTTQSHQSTQSSQSILSSNEYPIPATANLVSEYTYPRPPDRFSSPYKAEVRGSSRPDSGSGGTLTPQKLADHTQAHDNMHEHHVDVAKNVLSVDNGNDVEVIEYLETLPTPQIPPQPQQQADNK